MKYIPFRDGKINTRTVIKAIANEPSSPREGITAAEIFKRGRILDALDDLPSEAEGLRLEDADYQFLKSLLDRFTGFVTADRALRDILQDIQQAADA